MPPPGVYPLCVYKDHHFPAQPQRSGINMLNSAGFWLLFSWCCIPLASLVLDPIPASPRAPSPHPSSKEGEVWDGKDTHRGMYGDSYQHRCEHQRKAQREMEMGQGDTPCWEHGKFLCLPSKQHGRTNRFGGWRGRQKGKVCPAYQCWHKEAPAQGCEEAGMGHGTIPLLFPHRRYPH